MKATCIELMAKKQQKLYDVSSGLISALSEIHGGKWYANIRPLLVEHGICLHCQVYGRQIVNLDFPVRGETYRLRIMRITAD